MKQDYLTDEDIKKIVSKEANDALPLGSLVLMQIIDLPKAATAPSSPMSMPILGMRLLPLSQAETPKAIQDSIFSSLTPLHTLSTLTIIDNVQGGATQEEVRSEKKNEEEEKMREDEEKQEEEKVEEEKKEEEKNKEEET